MSMEPDDFANRCDQHRRDLLYYAYTCSRDLAVAEDIVQEALLIALKKREHYFPEADLKGWLISLVRNVWFRERERLMTRQRRLKFLEDNPTLLFDLEEEGGSSSADQRVLEKCLQKLDESDRSIIRDHFVGRLKYLDIANRMKKNLSWVKVRMFRARTALLECVEFNLRKEDFLNEI